VDKKIKTVSLYDESTNHKKINFYREHKKFISLTPTPSPRFVIAPSGTFFYLL